LIEEKIIYKMPIYIELPSLIVNKKAVESKYQGGID